MGNKLSSYRDEFERVVDLLLANICYSRNGAPFYDNYYGYGAHMGDDEFDATFRYLAIVDDREDYAANELSAASALGLVERNEDEDHVYAIRISARCLDKVESYSPGLYESLRALPVIYDTSEHPELVMTGDNSYRSTIATYSGDVSENIAYFACRARIIEASNAFWRSRAVVNRTYPTRSMRKIGSLKKAESLINAMLMGHERVHLTQRRGVVPDKVKNMLSRIEYTSDQLPEEVWASTKALNMFEDITPLWQSALRYSSIAMTFDDNQQELADENGLLEKFKALSKFTCMEEYLDAYFTGVPASDILA